jgi:hypothetical protein
VANTLWFTRYVLNQSTIGGAVVGPFLLKVLDFDRIPGTTLRHHVQGLVTTASLGSGIQINCNVDTPGTPFDSNIRTDPVVIATGTNFASSTTFTKQSGIKQLSFSYQMVNPLASGSFVDLEIHTEIVSNTVQKIWELPLNQFVGWQYLMSGLGPAHEDQAGFPGTAGGKWGYFDFSQIPLGATVTVVVAGGVVSISAAVYNIRVSDVADRNNTNGDIILSTPISSATFTFAAHTTFTNIYTGVKLIKVTGYYTASSSAGAIVRPSLLLYY